ncbi:TRAP transporter small permease [Paracoccus sp. Z330]|uniref:TRAP transporter small permease protein n=1 Tax=Paracoccus onchidii TaxID=3017813 RepID=A0ABT4ZD65_9RHOB|nr:TRAP transporter small permease [Paracoccus onchidii]MDB6177291.1 TRAP transporter small permease [Paracoccus onchidii]
MLHRPFEALVALNTFLIRACTAIIAALLGVIVIVMITAVTMRYGLGNPLSWGDDLSQICLVWLTMLGLVVGMRPGHLAVEGLVQSLPARLEVMILVAIHVMVLAMSLLVVWYGIAFARQGMARIVPSMDWLSQGYIYAAVPVAFALIVPSCLEAALSPFLRRTANDGRA